jgi:RNA polymerase sigma-70 factor (ECF subfamily)
MPTWLEALRLRCMGAAPDRAEELFQEHSRRIYAYCLRQLGSPEEAEDALQATYLNACRSLLAGFEPKVAQAWLYKVAHNVCLTRQRSSWRRSRVERPQDIQSIEEFIAAPEEQGEELLGIEDALLGLPDQQRRAILLREWQGLSYREVAAEMGLSQSAVETLLFRARRSLAAALDEPEITPERRARFLGLLDGAALLAALKSSLAGSLGSSLAAGLAVTASTTLIAATPLSNVRALELSTAVRAGETQAAPERTTPRRAPADHDRASAERSAASRSSNGTSGKSKAHAYGRGHANQPKPDHAGKPQKTHAKTTKAGGRKPSWAGSNPAPVQASSAAENSSSSNIGGNGKSQGASKSSK